MGRILIYISLIILLRYAYTYVNNRSEYFENHLNLLDNVDEVYAKFYNIVFNESFVFDYDYKIIKNTLKKNSRILDAGTGTGKYYNYFIKNYDIIGVDMSRDFLKHAKINSPLGKFVEGNLINPGLERINGFFLSSEYGFSCASAEVVRTSPFGLISNAQARIKAIGNPIRNNTTTNVATQVGRFNNGNTETAI